MHKILCSLENSVVHTKKSGLIKIKRKTKGAKSPTRNFSRVLSNLHQFLSNLDVLLFFPRCSQRKRLSEAGISSCFEIRRASPSKNRLRAVWLDFSVAISPLSSSSSSAGISLTGSSQLLVSCLSRVSGGGGSESLSFSTCVWSFERL